MDIETIRRKLAKFKAEGDVDGVLAMQELLDYKLSTQPKADTSKSDFDESVQHAEKLATLINDEKGLRANAWFQKGVGVRVYIMNAGYLTVSRGGQASASLRGKYTFLESDLYKNQRVSYHTAIKKYLDYLDRYYTK